MAPRRRLSHYEHNTSHSFHGTQRHVLKIIGDEAVIILHITNSSLTAKDLNLLPLSRLFQLISFDVDRLVDCSSANKIEIVMNHKQSKLDFEIGDESVIAHISKKVFF